MECHISAVETRQCCSAGFENSVAGVMEDLLASLDNPSLAMLQWDEVFSVVQVKLYLSLWQIVSVKEISHMCLVILIGVPASDDHQHKKKETASFFLSQDM